ncbi:MAG: GNA1162 family protein [Nitrospinota bacterium]|nr:GNA1162 family protein [Nitrospinota bacterium]
MSFSILFSACTTNLQSKVSGNLNNLSRDQTVAILPIETTVEGQKEAAEMFRQNLFANLKQSKFNVLERYVVDGLLQQNGLTDPSKYLTLNPMTFAEILGADAVLISRMNKVERSYMVVHSSIELSISAQIVDTRTGEILWRAEQTESDFQGIGKIPTGIAAAILGPIHFVTNKLNLNKLTSKMASKLTALVKKPEEADKEKKFEEKVIAANASRDLKKLVEINKLRSRWAEAYKADGFIENVGDELEQAIEENPQTASLTEEEVVLNANTAPEPVAPAISKVQTVDLSPFNDKIQPLKINYRPSPPAEKAATAEKSIAAPVKNPKALYTVQVGAYQTKALAEKMIRDLSKKGYDTFLSVLVRDEKEIYRVQVERFPDRDTAMELAEKIESREKLSNFITTVNPD